MNLDLKLQEIQNRRYALTKRANLLVDKVKGCLTSLSEESRSIVNELEKNKNRKHSMDTGSAEGI